MKLNEGKKILLTRIVQFERVADELAANDITPSKGMSQEYDQMCKLIGLFCGADLVDKERRYSTHAKTMVLAVKADKVFINSPELN